MSQFRSLLATVCLINFACFQHTGYKHFARLIPFQQGRRTLDRDTHSVHYCGVMFLAAGYQAPFLAGHVFPGYAERINAVYHSFSAQGLNTSIPAL